MSKILIIGAGGVGAVVAHKCATVPEFSEIMLASRTKSKCDKIAAQVKSLTGKQLLTAGVDADNVPELVGLIRLFRPAMVKARPPFEWIRMPPSS
jgi:saccharopine dehydrogenase (NAD+, L-lysine-forming)